MPIQSCTKNGKPGFRWGKTGKCYTYNNEKSRKAAISKAQKQQQAIKGDKL